MSDVYTYCIDEEGNSLGTIPGHQYIPVRVGMKMTFHGNHGEFHVVDWSYRHGHPDENPGLTIILRKQ